jgi:hypothetical protein
MQAEISLKAETLNLGISFACAQSRVTGKGCVATHLSLILEAAGLKWRSCRPRSIVVVTSPLRSLTRCKGGKVRNLLAAKLRRLTAGGELPGFFPDYVLVVPSVDQRIYSSTVISTKQLPALDAVAKEYIRRFRNE